VVLGSGSEQGRSGIRAWPGRTLLGPYPSRHEAENWKAKVDERNEGWDDADEAWEHAGESDDD
jgi:hypothetical protein